jgi:hypothetical protein
MFLAIVAIALGAALLEAQMTGTRINGSGEDPALARRIEVMQRIVNEGTPPIVVVDHPLPDGAVVIQNIGSKHSLGTYIVVAKDRFTSSAINDALAHAYAYMFALEMGHIPKEGPVTITWYADGRSVEQRQAGGRYELRRPPSRAPEDPQLATKVRSLALQGEVVTLPELGVGRIVRLRQ